MSNPFGETAPLVDLDALQAWILRDDEELLVINKPGWLVCHPSKNGPLSSLVGAVRELTGAEKLHLVARLDRETSGLVVFAKRPAAARKYQMAIQNRIVAKTYLAILEGTLEESILVDQSIARRKQGLVHVKNEVSYVRGAQSAITRYVPIAHGGGYTLARVEPETGRKHQIRVHAEWLEHRVVGDKIYGPDESLYLDFIENGWTPKLEAALPMKRQALHCYEYCFQFPEQPVTLTAPLLEDMQSFCRDEMGLEAIPTIKG
ncbi:RluA family pseudouridine synthase [Coraliomargarita akajimensis]|uniref:Pseudouridine synthase n=1 Tax=Coraliomargarita akajimensis (strain DSM 45221 / IAM 15411 / JCM 23193 / KCTC 12865 / 04OKA010-24) TaxID=583355 RepID=D5EIS4_CORAD|nr:RNA pseudouridine synthase [Coraliomargarita akajimensis]ADE54323.1 pseudouridine synthase [Coraliomargarita akajimensis DSM 45221]